ncbi:MAG: hypothetical protein KDA21_12470 [Phycisphaerales bacterium]|nr:hypothetical protein [Phycisphaerales bacterium]
MQIETPKPIRLLCLLLSVLTGVVALAGVALLPLSDDDRVWFGVAFQSFSLLASVYGVLVGLGRLKGTPALTMLTTGGMVFVAATLSEKSLSGLLANERVDPTTIGGVSVLPFALLQAAMGMAFIGLSALTVLIRRPRASMPYFFRGIAFGVPVVLILGALSVRGVRDPIMGLGKPVLVALLVLGGIFLGALVAISGHLLIRAFEVGQMDDGAAEPR